MDAQGEEENDLREILALLTLAVRARRTAGDTAARERAHADAAVVVAALLESLKPEEVSWGVAGMAALLIARLAKRLDLDPLVVMQDFALDVADLEPDEGSED